MSDGETIEEAIANGEDAKRGWIAAMREAGRPIPPPSVEAVENYSGKWQLRAPKSLHRRLAERAKHEGVSLNTWPLPCSPKVWVNEPRVSGEMSSGPVRRTQISRDGVARVLGLPQEKVHGIVFRPGLLWTQRRRRCRDRRGLAVKGGRCLGDSLDQTFSVRFTPEEEGENALHGDFG